MRIICWVVTAVTLLSLHEIVLNRLHMPPAELERDRLLTPCDAWRHNTRQRNSDSRTIYWHQHPPLRMNTLCLRLHHLSARY